MKRSSTQFGLSCLCWLLALSGCSGSDDSAADPAPPSYDESFLDTSAEPCTDFYQFACGTWLAEHPATPGYTDSRVSRGDARNSVYFQSLVEAMSSSDPTLRPAQTYYNSCLRARISAGTRPEPAVSVPRLNSTCPSATATAEPELEPPEM